MLIPFLFFLFRFDLERQSIIDCQVYGMQGIIENSNCPLSSNAFLWLRGILPNWAISLQGTDYCDDTSQINLLANADTLFEVC